MVNAPLKPPQIYSEWVEIFDILKSKTNDEAVLAAMYKGTVEWQCGVAERFIRKLNDVVNFRINAASDKFQRDLIYARGQENLIVQALLSLRKEINFLSQAVNLPAIPEKERVQYCQIVKKQADSMQTSLEDSAKKDRTGKLGSIVRNHKVNAF